MAAISIVDKVTCGRERCDLIICTNEGGDHARHYLTDEQRGRIVHPAYSDSPFQVWAYDLDGKEHEAVIPD